MEKVVSKVLPVLGGNAETLIFKIDESDAGIVIAFYQQNMAKLKEGRYIELTQRLWERKRTLEQNSLWHKILREMSQKLSTNIELIKQGIKESAMNEYGYPAVINPVTHRDSPKPSSEATVKEMAILFDVAFIEGASCGVDLSEFIEDVREWKKKNDSKT